MAETDTKPALPAPKSGWLRLVIAALGTLAGLAIFAIVARETFLRTEFELTTLVDDSAGIAPSSPVLLNGIDVGHVARITLSGSPDPEKTVRILMRFPRHVLNLIPEDSRASITSANLLGDKYMNIEGGKSPRHIQPGAEIPSSPTQDIGAVISRASVRLDQMNDVLNHFNRVLDYINKPQGTLGKFLNNGSIQQHIARVSSDQNRISRDLENGRGVLLRFNDLKAEAEKPLGRLRGMESDVTQGRGSLGRFMNDPYTPDLSAEARGAMREANDLIADFRKGDRASKAIDGMRNVGAKLDGLMARVESGQGTLGQFVVNPQLRDSLHRLSAEINAFTADFSKHPTRFVQLRFGLF